jgi:hypothetical protein
VTEIIITKVLTDNHDEGGGDDARVRSSGRGLFQNSPLEIRSKHLNGERQSVSWKSAHTLAKLPHQGAAS